MTQSITQVTHTAIQQLTTFITSQIIIVTNTMVSIVIMESMVTNLAIHNMATGMVSTKSIHTNTTLLIMDSPMSTTMDTTLRMPMNITKLLSTKQTSTILTYTE